MRLLQNGQAEQTPSATPQLIQAKLEEKIAEVNETLTVRLKEQMDTARVATEDRITEVLGTISKVKTELSDISVRLKEQMDTARVATEDRITEVLGTISKVKTELSNRANSAEQKLNTLPGAY